MNSLAKRIPAPRRAPDIVIGGTEDPYLLRWYLIPRNPVLNVYYHVFKRSDDDRALHDHPWVSLSLCLRGEATEIDAIGSRIVRAGQWRLRRAAYAHRMALHAGDCHTLFLTGPRIREWGFWCPQGWRHWRAFTSGRNGETIGRGCE
jgi:hypothetical protein